MSRRTELEARVVRSMIQNMQVVGANFNARTSAWTIRIKGTTGDRVYRVVFRTDATLCTCPDFFSRGGDHCKHIFFVVNRVLEDRRLAARMIDSPKFTPVNQLEPRIPDQFYYIFFDFDGIPNQQNTNANANANANANTSSLGTIQEQEECNSEDEDEDEETCVVCLDPLPPKRNHHHHHQKARHKNENGNENENHTSAVQRAHECAREREERTWTCRQCKNRLHHDCFQTWYFRAPGPGAPRCPLCRAPTAIWDQTRFRVPLHLTTTTSTTTTESYNTNFTFSSPTTRGAP